MKLSSPDVVFQQSSQDLGIPAQQLMQVVSDGLNNQGLSVGMLWDDTVQGYPDYNQTDGRCWLLLFIRCHVILCRVRC